MSGLQLALLPKWMPIGGVAANRDGRIKNEKRLYNTVYASSNSASDTPCRSTFKVIVRTEQAEELGGGDQTLT